MSESSRRRRGRGFVKGLLALSFLFGAALVAMYAFHVGFVRGLAGAGATLVVYSVPAALFDWPRLTLSDVVDFFLGVVETIGSFFSSLFD